MPASQVRHTRIRSGNDPKLVVVDLEADRRLPKQVTLAAIKADPTFSDLGLVRMSRLSVIPVPADQWTAAASDEWSRLGCHSEQRSRRNPGSIYFHS